MFLGIGAQKAGTTWLHEALAAHPGIAFPAGKEVHFWDWYHERGVDWYRARFANAPADRICGDITPGYAVLAVDVIREIHAFNPGLRILYTLRNPIDRAWSAANMVMQRAGMTFDEASDRWFIDHFRSHNSLSRGDYEVCLRNWHTVFAPEQLRVLRYEQLCADPRGYVQECCRHIGADPVWYESNGAAQVSNRVYAGPGVPLRASLRAVLVDLYAAKIESLAVYLGEDLSGWLEPTEACA